MEPVTKGLAAIKAKGKAFNEMIAETHGGYCNEPVLGSDYFSIVWVWMQP